MDTLRNKRILWIGTGDMGLPSLIQLLKRKDVDCADVIVVAGRQSSVTDKPAIYMALRKADIPQQDIDNLNMISRDNVTPEMMQEMRDEKAIPHIAVFAVPPAHLKSTLGFCRRVITPKTEIISMVTGADKKTYQTILNKKNEVTVVIPQIPRKICAILGDNENSIQTAELVCGGLGDLVFAKNLTDKNDQHALTAIIGTYPALVGHYILNYKSEEEQNRAIYWLKTFAAGEEGSSLSAVDNIIKEKCRRFYDYSLMSSKHFLGIRSGVEILNKSLDASLDYIYQNKSSIMDFILKVRSEKGTANAALVVSGSPPPDDPKYGNKTELIAQNFYARDFLSGTITEEEKIPYALTAALHRSKAMGEYPADALNGVDLDAIVKEVNVIKDSLGQSK